MTAGDDDGIVLEDGESKGRYVYRLDNAEAELTFTKVGAKRLILDHTGVPDLFRGQGIGARLVSRAVSDAREQGRTIIPLCTFAAAQFRRHPDWPMC